MSRDRDRRASIGALVGCGLIAEGHLDGYLRVPELGIGVVIEPNRSRRELAGRTIPGAKLVGSPEDVDLTAYDFVDICSPPSTHLDYARWALAAGLPTLVEKPLVLNLEELDALAAAEATSRGFINPCHNYSFAPSMQRLLELLPTMRATDGSPTRGHFRTLRAGHAQGVAEWNPDWRRDPAIGGGGILQDHGPHSIYIAIRAIGTQVSAVRCRTLRPGSGPFQHTEDLAKLDLHFECGSIVSIELDWGHSFRQSGYMFEGSWGYLRLLDDRLVGQGGGFDIREVIESQFNDPRHGSWFEAVLRNFRASWDDPSLATALRQEATEVVLIIAGAYRSSQAGGILLQRKDWTDPVELRQREVG